MSRYDDTVWPAGKWKGTPVGELPVSYLEWAAENMENAKLRNLAGSELRARGLAVPSPREKNPMDEIADRLFRKLGSLEAQVNDLGACLRQMMLANGLEAPQPVPVKSHGVSWYKDEDARDNNDYREPIHNKAVSEDDTIPF